LQRPHYLPFHCPNDGCIFSGGGTVRLALASRFVLTFED
jgi:hypothetical protein